MKTRAIWVLRRMFRAVWHGVRRGARWSRDRWRVRHNTAVPGGWLVFAMPDPPPATTIDPELRAWIEQHRARSPRLRVFAPWFALTARGVTVHARLSDGGPDPRPALLCVLPCGDPVPTCRLPPARVSRPLAQPESDAR